MSWWDWFDDETIYSAGISVTHLVPELPPNPLNAAVLGAIRNNGSIVNNAVAARNASMFSRVDAFLVYAKANYYRGLPNSTFPATLGDPLPIIAIRENRGNVLASGKTVAIETTKNTLKKLGLSLDKLTGAINASPNIGTVDDSYIMLGFNLMSDDPNGVEYFFNFLAVMYAANIRFSYTHPYEFAHNYAQYTQTVSLGGELDFTFLHKGISKRQVSGSIGPIGAFTRTIGTFTYYYSAVESREVYLFPFGPWYTENYWVNKSKPDHTFVLRKQVTANSFEEYRLFSPYMRNTIRIPTGAFSIQHSIGDTANRATFILPLFKNVLDMSNPFIQEQFLSSGLILYTHSIDSINIPWYQSPGFLAIVGFTVGIAIVLFTGGFAAGLGQGLIEVITQVAVAQALGVVSNAIIEIFSPIIGKEAVAVILVIVSIAIVHAKLGEIRSLGELPWAEDLLKASRGILDIVDIVNTKDALELTKDIAEFTKSADAFNEELARADKLLGTTDSNLKRSNINDIINAYETPEEFYTRTIHQGNIGVLGLDAIANYAANKLRLPKELPA